MEHQKLWIRLRRINTRCSRRPKYTAYVGQNAPRPNFFTAPRALERVLEEFFFASGG
jgi:hypothetical protein